ncbi:MAG: nucleotidyltransferase family protein [Clostridia bacterium]|nr:nucleotidyltransferase family protein [Clostridia bacterium]
MNEKERDIFFSILQSVIQNKPMNSESKQIASENLLSNIIRLAEKHDLAHLVALGAIKNGLVNDESKSRLQKYIFRAIYRHENQQYERVRICNAFEKAKISFIPLKGAVMQNYYPEPWMRTCSDLDILVKVEDLENAVSILVGELQFVERSRCLHDVALYSQNGYHIELHFLLIEDDYTGKIAGIFDNLWDVATARPGWLYQMEMPADLFYFYHVVHMSKHFRNGGCGIRSVLDLWILNHLPEKDLDKYEELLEKGGVGKFARNATLLGEMWFDNQPGNACTKKMEYFILSGGVYGTLQNRIVLRQQKLGGRLQYAFSKIVIPYDLIKRHYPILQKHKWLTPVMQVRRWFKLVFCGHAKRSMRELLYNHNVSREKADEMQALLDELGL